MKKFNPQIFEEMISRLTDAVPASLLSTQKDIESNFRSIIQTMLAKLDVVSREEFDTQTHVLLRTREKLHVLEEKMQQLEEKLQQS